MTERDVRRTVRGVPLICVYVDEMIPARKFYERYLGFEQTAEYAPGEIYGTLGEIEMWLGEGYTPKRGGVRATRAAPVMQVDSVGDLFGRLTSGGERVVQESPVEMRPGLFWLQFYDPAGNVIEVIGGE